MTASGDRAWAGRRVHFVGVGGAGMSGYARAVHSLGAVVSGSDARTTPYSEALLRDGILRAHIGYARENIPSGEDVEVVYSSAVPAGNPERAQARDRGLEQRPRAHLLGELTALRPTIAVAGTHGKTTTSAMIVHALIAAGLAPGWMIGAEIGGGLPNASWGGKGWQERWMVVEADESDRSMLSLDVDIAIVTNLELDHHETYRTYDDLAETFRRFLAGARRAIVSYDVANLRELMPDLDSQAKPEGKPSDTGDAADQSRPELEPECEPAGSETAEPKAKAKAKAKDGASEVVLYDACDVTLTAGGSRFRWRGHVVDLAVPGIHNARNAVAALEACAIVGAPARETIHGLAGFGGASRRFQSLGRTARGRS